MIRKQNSIFKTAFISDVNNNLINTDCFAHVELDDFACYVIADGIDDKYGGQAARLCVDSIISKFTEPLRVFSFRTIVVFTMCRYTKK